jgi:hypothetical protein
MADDELGKFEAVFGALSKMTSGEEDNTLGDARCPKCNASSFVKVSELYEGATFRRELGEPNTTPGDAGLTDEKILSRFAPPPRRSAVTRAVVVAVPLGVAVGYVFKRFGADVGEGAAIGAVVIVIIVLLTSMRRLSDEYYIGRARWRKLYMCRQCGEVVKA